jgi:hypothetical protein
LTPRGRIEVVQQAGKDMQPALERFYDLLNDQQKAHFNLLGSQER